MSAGISLLIIFVNIVSDIFHSFFILENNNNGKAGIKL
ncbi:MAG: hypothetical protein ACJAS1_006714 [Oleiphilaceae bacterium]